MKKTILATMLTSLFAVSAHSATVYEADGVTLDLFGDVEVQAGKSTDNDAPKMINLDDADFGLQVGYALTEDLSAVGKIAVTGEDEDIDEDNSETTPEINLDEAYAGLSSAHWGTFTVGQQYLISDDIGIGNDYAFGISSAYAGSLYDGRQSLKYSVDKGNFYFGLSYLLNTDSAPDQAESIDAKLGVRLDALDLTAFLGKTDEEDGTSATSVILEARYAIDALELAASIGTGSGDTDAQENTTFGLAGVYSVDKMTYSAAWSIKDQDDNEDKVNSYFVNAAYAFNSNVTVYAEVGANDGLDDSGLDTELGYVAGMAVTF